MAFFFFSFFLSLFLPFFLTKLTIHSSHACLLTLHCHYHGSVCPWCCRSYLPPDVYSTQDCRWNQSVRRRWTQAWHWRGHSTLSFWLCMLLLISLQINQVFMRMQVEQNDVSMCKVLPISCYLSSFSFQWWQCAVACAVLRCQYGEEGKVCAVLSNSIVVFVKAFGAKKTTLWLEPCF